MQLLQDIDYFLILLA